MMLGSSGPRRTLFLLLPFKGAALLLYPHQTCSHYIFSSRQQHKSSNRGEDEVIDSWKWAWSHLLAVVKHSEEEHGHQEQRRLFGSQEVPDGAEREKKKRLTLQHGDKIRGFLLRDRSEVLIRGSARINASQRCLRSVQRDSQSRSEIRALYCEGSAEAG